MIRTAACVTLLLAVAGCALATATPPTVEVLDMHLTGIGLLEQNFAMSLCVTNPNADALSFRHVTADLDVSGLRLATSASDQTVRLPPRSSTIVPFSTVTTVRNVVPQLLGVVQSGAIEYRVHGTITLMGDLGFTLPYSRTGQVDLATDGLSLLAVSEPRASTHCTVQ